MDIGCICCANGNDLPDGEYCRACGNGLDEILETLQGDALDAFLRAEGFDPQVLLAEFNAAFPSP